MNPLHPRRQHRLSHLLASLLVSALPLLAIAPTLVWQEKQDLRRQAQQQVEQAQVQVDEILDQAELAGRAILPLAGGDCAVAEPELRRQAAIVPFVRSTALMRGGAIYCTSLVGDIAHPKPYASRFAAGRLSLLPGNRTTPDVPVLHVRQAGPRGDAIAAVDGRYLQLALQDASDNAPVYLIVGQQWLGPRRTGAGRPPYPAQIQASRQSARYPYAVATGYALPGSHQLLWRRHAALLLVAAALGLLAGGTLYWLLGRPDSPSDELRRALDNEEFEGFLQPLVKPGLPGWHGAEVLMRWRHPREGLIRPDLFIPRAEESGLIVPMTRRMMDSLVRQLGPLRLPAGFHLGFNISRAHLDDPRFYSDCETWQRALAASGAVLTLELTEREIIAITPAVEVLFRQLHELGVKIALDDFGTGHSSLVYLQQLAVDGLKIDQSFVAGIGSDGLSAHIVDSVAELAAKLGLETVAEGVETLVQFDYLSRLGVGWLQGYLIARPMPLDEFTRRWRAGDTWRGPSDAAH
ncbi:EAL domain-containing protein [Chromobacterium alticapitis]|uniref:cyclic-guanylate-specific phosphodiesterase n=1 Tax=Chromobacterium alticapitis TaxID=2073169 RepID=A0A2S5DIX6_9NEIS|nr:cyclic diguanylate phosphodiesterase [Chromobacterium alticapitis]POZ62961.1 cyclic diguanylate phosphodiesterase [Chromobacterium alticapitis]